MKLSTRLLLSLLPTVTLIMVAYAVWALLESEGTLQPQVEQGLAAYATVLGLVVDRTAATPSDIGPIVDALKREPSVYAVIVYDSTGRQAYAADPQRSAGSAPLAVLQRVLTTGRQRTVTRELGDELVLSVLRPLRGRAGHPVGVLEVAQRISFIGDQLDALRLRFLLNTVSLLVAVTLVTLWLVRRVVSRPMARLAVAARTVGGGDLSYRIPEGPSGAEMEEIAREFNGMAQRLEVARAEAAHQVEDRIALERRLREAEKMAEIGNLAAGLAHEVAAPLNVISGRAEMMLRTPSGPEVQERHLQIIIRQISRITRTVRNLLDFAKRREPKLREIDVTEVVDGAMALLDTELERTGVTVHRDLEGPLLIRGDPDLLHQLFVNLLMNASQAMELASSEQRTILIRGRARDRRVEVEVVDSGPGVPADSAAQVFSPFYTTKPQGTGLGLAVARRVAEEHGGRLTLEPEEQAGACFRLEFPMAEGASAPPADA